MFVVLNKMRFAKRCASAFYSSSAAVCKFVVAAAVLLCGQCVCYAATYSELEKSFNKGAYEECGAACQVEIDRRTWNPRFTILLVRCQMALGKYNDAMVTYESGLPRFGDDLRMRLVGHEVYRVNNRGRDAKEQLRWITELVQRNPWRFGGVEDLVPLGQLLVQQGEDARQVLELCYDRALKHNASDVEALVASTELALEKADFAVAATTIEKAIKVQPENAQLYYLKARAWEQSDSEKAEEALNKAIELNPRHVLAMLMVAENQIDGEEFDEAEKTIEQAREINPREPQAWALRAVVAHLRGEYEREGEYRKEALKPWELNPDVDYTIGIKLSRHYRFDDAVEAMRRALMMDPSNQNAMFALSQDLLRLGRTDEGWKLLAAVRSNDQYNVVAFNLTQLKDQLAKFKTLEAPGLVVRMETREAEVYGKAVLDLLSRARGKLTEKYKVQLQEPIYIEIFNRQQDFAIRTFGLPGGAGYLGVCFGRLITANSPVSGGANPTNWESVLWHEYCHVITLQKSKNRMPRWLSEGISVYEERVEDPTWGQPMDRHYRQMILSDDFTPISQLSSAFLSPKSGMHLQFAYFESSLAVQFLIEQYGFESLLRVLDDLGAGVPMNPALERLTGSLTALDEQFKNYAEAKAKAYAPEGDWTALQQEQPEDEKEDESDDVPSTPRPSRGMDAEQLKSFLDEHPKSPLALRTVSELTLQARQYDSAKEYLLRLQMVEPEDASVDGVYAMLAAAYRGLEQEKEELDTLRKLVEICPNPLSAIERLVPIEIEAGNWSAVEAMAKKYLTVHPMRSLPHEWVVKLAQHENKMEIASSALNALLQLDPLDPAELHYMSAQSLKASDPVLAKRHVLQCLEIAPRYLQAYELLEHLSSEATETRVSE
jgi:tetratricopeptide (TPR) repeat protein